MFQLPNHNYKTHIYHEFHLHELHLLPTGILCYPHFVSMNNYDNLSVIIFRRCYTYFNYLKKELILFLLFLIFIELCTLLFLLQYRYLVKEMINSLYPTNVDYLLPEIFYHFHLILLKEVICYKKIHCFFLFKFVQFHITVHFFKNLPILKQVF